MAKKKTVLTRGQKSAVTRKRKAAGKKAASTKRERRAVALATEALEALDNDRVDIAKERLRALLKIKNIWGSDN